MGEAAGTTRYEEGSTSSTELDGEFSTTTTDDGEFRLAEDDRQHEPDKKYDLDTPEGVKENLEQVKGREEEIKVMLGQLLDFNTKVDANFVRRMDGLLQTFKKKFTLSADVKKAAEEIKKGFEAVGIKDGHADSNGEQFLKDRHFQTQVETHFEDGVRTPLKNVLFEELAVVAEAREKLEAKLDSMKEVQRHLGESQTSTRQGVGGVYAN